MKSVPPQAAVALVALVVWSFDPNGALLWLLSSYAIAWLVLNAIAAARPRWLSIPMTRGQAIAIAALLAAPSTVQAVRFYEGTIEREGLAEIDHQLGWRMRLEQTPSIAPPLVAGDRPQTFYVHAPGAREVSVRFGEPRVRAVSLGHGLFRAEYDPRRHGAIEDGPVRAEIVTDGDAHERTMEGVVPLAHPRWLVPSPDRSRAAAVSEETDELYVLDARGLVLRAATDDGPIGAAFAGDEVLVAHRYADTLLFVDREGNAARRRRIGPSSHRLAAHGDRIAIAQHGERPRILVLRARDGARLAAIETPYRADGIAFADERTLIASSAQPAAIHRLRIESGALVPDGSLPLGRPAVALAAANGRVYAAVTDYRPNGPPHSGNHFVQDQILTFDAERWELVHRRFTALRTPRQRGPGDVDRGGSPIGIDPQADGSILVAFAGTDEIWRVHPEHGEPDILDLDKGSSTPAPISAVALGGAIAISSPSYGAIAVYRDGAPVHTQRFAPDDDVLMREDERALQRRIGERMFYESTRAGISCQSCHLHGASDGGLHNIGGYAMLATLDVRGVLGTPPYLRDGTYPTIASFEDNLTEPLLRGYRRDQGGRAISLERYVESLPRAIPPRQLGRRDLARERRGLSAFVRARCPMCHTLPAFTNLAQHPLRAIFPALDDHDGFAVDTPSLLGLAESGPYLVDGRAETLEAIFREHDRARRHGDWASLSDRELADLLHFIEGL